MLHGSGSNKRIAVAVAGGFTAIVLGLAMTGADAHQANVDKVDGKGVFRNHCAACHGEQGDGNGPAAKYLNPRPRDLSANTFRLTTTVNQVPSDADLMRVIDNGMPGSAMMPFGHLPQAEKTALIAYIRELMAARMLREAIEQAKTSGEKTNEATLKDQVREQLKPGTKLEMPKQWPAADKASIERGQQHYANSCLVCHGPTGKGDGSIQLQDESGNPITPRDFSRGIYKGGRDNESIYARIVLGMKGSLMPGNTTMKPEEVGDLINYMNSLSSKQVQAKIQHLRTNIVAKRIEKPLLDDMTEVWNASKPANIVISPLWWRDYIEPDFRVWAAHDGKNIAIRLAWFDSTRDDQPKTAEYAEDMAALQLTRLRPEPFLGMGADGKTVDLWLWRSSSNKPGEPADAKSKVMSPFDPATTAAGQGPGVITFQPKPSTVSTARSSWLNRQWLVEFRRPLQVKPGDGVTLVPGQPASIAFAIWDGASKDRKAQKQVSIWHDLSVE